MFNFHPSASLRIQCSKNYPDLVRIRLNIEHWVLSIENLLYSYSSTFRKLSILFSYVFMYFRALKQLFHIKSDSPGDGSRVLSLITGISHIGFAICNKEADQLYELVYCKWEEADSLDDLFTAYPSLNRSFGRVCIAFDNPQQILLPPQSFKPESSGALLKSVHGVYSDSLINSDWIGAWQLNNTYAIPLDIKQAFARRYNDASYMHLFTVGLNKILAAEEGGTMFVNFGTDYFSALVVKSSRLLIANCFSYNTPDDVLYHLLKICDQLSLSGNEVNLHVSGLIEKDSALYKELCQYFLKASFRNAEWSIPDYPAHFFTQLNDLASCAS